MKYCSSCGMQIDINVSFCPHCGAMQSAQSTTSRTPARSGQRLHCPKCKTSQLSPIVETDIQGSTAVHTPINRRVSYSTIQTHSIHREYWMCQNCGHKFRNLENLTEEIGKETARMKLIVVPFVCFTVLLLLVLKTNFWLWGIILFLPAILLSVAIYLSTKRKVQTMTKEKKYLSTHCFD